MQKAYFTASIVAKKQYVDNYQQIIKILSKDYDVQSDHIMLHEEEDIRLQTREERLAFNKKLHHWISSAEFIVVEASFPSISVGYEISLALQMGKPVLILYSEGDPPALFANFSNANLVCEHYTPQNLKGLIGSFINYIQGKSDSRFTFYITPEISSHLDAISREEKVPKSIYLRKLIEDDMKKRSSS